MDSLSTGRVAHTLQRLFEEAEKADRPLMEQFQNTDGSELNMDELIEELHEKESRDLRGYYHSYVGNFLNVTPEFGRFLYQSVRSRRAARIVEFGTSMGVSTIHLAAALRDLGGGTLIGTELEPSKAAYARENLEAAGLADLVEIRVGDARETLADIGDGVDFVLLDGAFSLYLPVLKILEPHLKVGTPILAENALGDDNEYLAYVRNAANGYISQPIPIAEGRGNEFTIRTR